MSSGKEARLETRPQKSMNTQGRTLSPDESSKKNCIKCEDILVVHGINKEEDR